MGHRYRSLNIGQVQDTLHQLRLRIEDRFPGSGLGRVCAELETLSEETRRKLEWISRPNWWLRGSIWSLVALIAMLLVYTLSTLKLESGSFTLADLVQMSEAGINDLVLIGAALFFLSTVETRIKRGRALRVLYELRSIAHVIDMHQLTKDPSRNPATATEHSPRKVLTGLQLTRYLSYCSEMLSLTSKVAAVYAQAIDDSVVLDSVNEMEDLTTGLNQKIWQKIMVIREWEKEETPESSQADLGLSP